MRPSRSPRTTHPVPARPRGRRLLALAAAAVAAPAVLVATAAPSTAVDDRAADRAKDRAVLKDHQNPRDTLRAAAPKGFYLGSAVAGGGHHEEQPYADPFAYDVEYRDRLAREFSSLSAENQMKWEYIHPQQGFYNFYPADAIVRFAQEHDQVVRGHTLLWHSQNPEWLTEGDFTDEELREILRDHISTVVSRYAGRIQQWDVANEIFTEEGEFREENIWITRLGPGIIADAFRWAHEADPKAKLYFNDYNVESFNAKSDAYYELIQDLLADGVPVHGFAPQSHLSTQYGFPNDLRANLQRFVDLGLETAITEIDVRMEVGEDGPTAAQLAQQADYYQRALQACLDVRECKSFTIWGFTDKYSWVPVFFPSEGSATVTTETYERKPAYNALQDTLRAATRAGWGR
ncbi:endo-1,4-beta-xylanase [Kineococcus terrestris]|uniref:endo-1,4-beta-xylanase n=1 Tax=Kineococcus terrestris TaxID=2044856 RepID=UPI0034DAF820